MFDCLKEKWRADFALKKELSRFSGEILELLRKKEKIEDMCCK